MIFIGFQTVCELMGRSFSTKSVTLSGRSSAIDKINQSRCAVIPKQSKRAQHTDINEQSKTFNHSQSTNNLLPSSIKTRYRAHSGDIKTAIKIPLQPPYNFLDRIANTALENQHANHLVNERFCGLENFGDSCYVNSALQCLSHAEPLTSALLHLKSDEQDLKPLTEAYVKLLKEMWLGNESVTSAIKVRDRVSEISPRFASQSQQDSHEFLSVFLDTLYEELFSHEQGKQCNIDENFIHGTIKSTVKCLNCPEETVTYDSFISLPLPVPLFPEVASGLDKHEGFIGFVASMFAFIVKNITPDNDLHACFKLLLKNETIGENGKWFCTGCNCLTNANKKIELWTLPKVLILQLKRFNYDLLNNVKIDTFIDYPVDLLDLSNYVANAEYNKTIRYDLVAVSVHTGNLVGGHYITYGRNFRSANWYRFDDQHVRKATSTEIFTRDAYILVYVQHSYP
jgi:ubiquitin carboxyl-terminal hydrolase 8